MEPALQVEASDSCGHRMPFTMSSGHRLIESLAAVSWALLTLEKGSEREGCLVLVGMAADTL